VSRLGKGIKFKIRGVLMEIDEHQITSLKLEILLRKLRVVNYSLDNLEINRLRRLIEVKKINITIPSDYII
jgi:hypothetical protein